jgi:1-phosphatidylinositol-4-phosphate 5-kinase
MSIKSVVLNNSYVLNERDFKLKYYFELIPRRLIINTIYFKLFYKKKYLINFFYRTTSQKDNFKICKFYDYAPYVFNEIRKLKNITNEEYLQSLGLETMLSSILKGDLNSLSELTSSGKSGSFFYYTVDGKLLKKIIIFFNSDKKLKFLGKYTLKTIHKAEFKLFRKILKSYFEYLYLNPSSLIIK